MIPRESGIYCLKNIINGKCYIGGSVNMYKRANYHINNMKVGNGCNKNIQKDFDTYGKDAFQTTVLELCIPEEIHIKELYYINLLKTTNRDIGYNIEKRSSKGIFSQENRDKIRMKSTGRKASIETKAKMSKAQKGKSVGEETRKKISQKAKGRPCSKETRIKMGIAGKGRKHSSESVLHRAAKHRMRKTVKCYDLEGNYIREYFSISVAAKDVGNGCYRAGIVNCAKGKTDQYKGYKWQYNDIPPDKDMLFIRCKKVQCFSLNHKLIAEYPSLRNASRSTNTALAGIRKCIAGIFKQSNGFIWKYPQP